MPIEPHTLRELLDAVYEMNSARSHADFAAAVVAGMRRLIPADVTVFQVLNRATGEIVTRMAPADPYTPEEVAHYSTHSDTHPLVAYFARTGNVSARRISDVIDRESWLRSDFYRTCLQRLGLEHSLALPISVDESIVAGRGAGRAGGAETLRGNGPHAARGRGAALDDRRQAE